MPCAEFLCVYVYKWGYLVYVHCRKEESAIWYDSWCQSDKICWVECEWCLDEICRVEPVMVVEKIRVFVEHKVRQCVILDNRHWALESNPVSLSHLHEGERERHKYTAATEVVSIASQLFSRDAARCCRAVAAPRGWPLRARAREFQIP